MQQRNISAIDLQFTHGYTQVRVPTHTEKLKCDSWDGGDDSVDKVFVV